MGGAALTGAGPIAASGSWKLAADVASDAQGLVVSGFGDLPAACAMLLSAQEEGGAWIAALQGIAPVSAADGKQVPSVALAFTSLGLKQLGLERLLPDFAQPFVEGMMQEDRRRRLGDVTEDGAVPPTIQWGLRADAEKPLPPAHALLLVYERSHDALAAHEARIWQVLAPAGVQVVRRIALDLRPDDDCREHFGFVDGISQPIPYGAGTSDGSGKPCPQDPLHGVPLGEILLGHPDAHAHASQGPFMVGALTPDGAFTPSSASPEDAAVTAMRDPAAETLRDLGRNGSYLVVRELRQNVEGFKSSLAAEAAKLNAHYPEKKPIDGDWLAERVMGRTHDGHMLRPDGPLPPGPDGQPDNDFLYVQKDRYGRGCPLGSHVRRANPRDGLAFRDDVCADLLHSANAHRILRRGRKFGGDVAGSEIRGDEGLLFMCLNGDISRQFEFVQQNWMLNPNFAALFDEVDPLVGPAGTMTLPDDPLRRRIDVATYITLVGGDYFFLPSLSALAVFAALRPGAAP